MNIQSLPLSSIDVDCGTQMRVSNCEKTIAEYAEDLRQGCVFPAVIVFSDGTSFWLADGFHRFEAHLRCGRDTILCEIREGTLVDAKKHACKANIDHGLRRTNEGKRNVVKEYLLLPGIAEMSDLKIADELKVSNHLVHDIRVEMNIAPSPKSHVGKGSQKKGPTTKKKEASSSSSKVKANGSFTNLYNVSKESPEQFVTILHATFDRQYLDSLLMHLRRSLSNQ